MKKTNKKSRAIIVLAILLLALAVGYAAFQTVLLVDGTATGADVSWNVHFTNATKLYEVANDGSKGAEVASTRGTVTLGTASTSGVSHSQTATVTVNLAYPGDEVLLETVIENTGTLDAKLTGFQVTGASNGLIVTSPTNSAITVDSDVIHATNGTCTAQFLVKWDDTVPSFGDSSTHQQDFDITFTYSQNTATKAAPTLTHTDT